MKHFINILLILILTGFAVGIAYLATHFEQRYSVLFIPECAFIFLLGLKLNDDYK